MQTTRCIEQAGSPDPYRRVIGLEIASDCTRVAATMVTAVGRGMHLQPQLGQPLIVPVPKETTRLWNQLLDSTSVLGAADTVDAILRLRRQLADCEAAAVEALMEHARIAPSAILALSTHDSGLWDSRKGSIASYLGLSDPARLAEKTGLTVIDAFPARDLASGGQGGPLMARAQWVLLGHPKYHRVLLDLGRTIRLTYLPAGTVERGPPRLLAFDVGPGMQLIDLLAQKLTHNQHPFDPGGRLAVQGQCLAPLVQHWLADPYFRRSIPRWHPRGVPAERFLLEALRMAVEAGWSVRDLLCSATHFVAEAVLQAVRTDLPSDAPIEQILVTGGGQQNGMLLRELARLFPHATLHRLEEFGTDSQAFGPACVAILGFFYLDQIPATSPEITGAEVPRVLGRLTPGSPRNWQRLLESLHDSPPAVRPLRVAI